MCRPMLEIGYRESKSHALHLGRPTGEVRKPKNSFLDLASFKDSTKRVAEAPFDAKAWKLICRSLIVVS